VHRSPALGAATVALRATSISRSPPSAKLCKMGAVIRLCKLGRQHMIFRQITDWLWPSLRKVALVSVYFFLVECRGLEPYRFLQTRENQKCVSATLLHGPHVVSFMGLAPGMEPRKHYKLNGAQVARWDTKAVVPARVDEKSLFYPRNNEIVLERY
jgi:hypothetical protein